MPAIRIAGRDYEEIAIRQIRDPIQTSITSIALPTGAATEATLAQVRDAIKATRLTTTVGPVNFATGPVPNISKTPLVSGQWRKSGKGLELAVVENSQAPSIAVQGKLAAIKG